MRVARRAGRLGSSPDPGEKLIELDQLIPRFSKVAQLSVVTLIVTGVVHALAVAGGISELAGSVRSGPADQGHHLRADAADGQPRS